MGVDTSTELRATTSPLQGAAATASSTPQPRSTRAASRAICATSSRVGAKIATAGNFGVFFSRANKKAAAGTTKAPVLPEPVGAVTSASRPAASAGHACACTEVGSCHAHASSAARSRPSRVPSSQDAQGRGTASSLSTRSRRRFRKARTSSSDHGAGAPASAAAPAAFVRGLGAGVGGAGGSGASPKKSSDAAIC